MMTLIICLGVIAIGAQLWRMGGDGYDWARMFAFPALIAIVKTCLLWNIWGLVYGIVLWGLISAFSYGVNAPIRKLWVFIFKQGEDGNFEPVEIATRATCGFLWSFSGLVFTILTGHWYYQVIYTVVLTIANAYFGRLQNVEVSERGVGASVAISIFI